MGDLFLHVNIPTHVKDHTFDLVLSPLGNLEIKDMCVSDHKAIIFNAPLLLSPSKPPSPLIPKASVTQPLQSNSPRLFWQLTLINLSQPPTGTLMTLTKPVWKFLTPLLLANKLQIFHDILKNRTVTYQSLVKDARASYFSDLISENCENPKVLIQVISPSQSHGLEASTEKCEDFLAYFIQVDNLGCQITPFMVSPLTLKTYTLNQFLYCL